MRLVSSKKILCLGAFFAVQAAQTAQAAQAAYAAGGEAACRRAVLAAGGGAKSSPKNSRQLRETLIRSYESIHKKKRGRGRLQSRLNSLAKKSLSAKETLSRLMAEGLISPESSSPLFGLILNQPPDMAARLAESSPEAVQEGALLGSPPFFIAVLTGEKEAAEAFLKAAPDLIHSENIRGESPLHYALEPEMAELLLSRGADPDRQDKKGFAPLHYARGAALAKTLLSHDADWRLKDRSGQPLIRHHETAVRDPEIIRLLKEASEESRKRHSRAAAPPRPDLEEQREREREAEARAAAARAEHERAERERRLRQEKKRERKHARAAGRAEREREKQARAAAARQAAAWDRLFIVKTIAAIEAFDISKYAFFINGLRASKKDLLRDHKQQLKNLGGSPKDFRHAEGARPDESEFPDSIKDLIEKRVIDPQEAERDIKLGLKKIRERITKRINQKAKKAQLESSPEAMALTADSLIERENEALQDLRRLRDEAINSNPTALFFLYSLSAGYQIPLLVRRGYERGGALGRIETYMEEAIKEVEGALVMKLDGLQQP